MKTNSKNIKSIFCLINPKGILGISIIVLLFATSCDKEDAPQPQIDKSAPTIKIGNDTTVLNSTTFKLKTIATGDSGRWSIISGLGGQFENETIANTNFTGTINTVYQLRYVAYNAFGTVADTISVTLKSQLTPTEMVANIHWLGQSDFRIETAGKIIYIDHTKNVTDKPADLILITHNHADHFSAAAIAKVANENTIIIGPANCRYTGTCKEFIPILPGGEYKLNDFVTLKAVAAYNIVKTQFHPINNKNVAYLITSEGETIYHTGDTERIPEMQQFTADIALMPLGHTYTMNSVDEAVEATKDIKAKIAIPMHFGTYEGTAADAESYKTKLNGFAEVEIKTKE